VTPSPPFTVNRGDRRFRACPGPVSHRDAAQLGKVVCEPGAHRSVVAGTFERAELCAFPAAPSAAPAEPASAEARFSAIAWSRAVHIARQTLSSDRGMAGRSVASNSPPRKSPGEAAAELLQ